MARRGSSKNAYGALAVVLLLWAQTVSATALSREQWVTLVRVDPAQALARVRGSEQAEELDALFRLRIECESLRDLGRYRSVVALAGSVPEASSLGHPDEIAVILCLGFGHEQLGAMTEAAAAYEQAGAMALALGNEEAQVRALYGRARIKWQEGDDVATAEALMNARRLLRLDMDARVHAAILYQFGALLRRFGAYPEAIRSYEQAEAHARRDIDNAALLPVLNALGASYLDIGDTAMARTYFTKVQGRARAADLRSSFAVSATGLLLVALAEQAPTQVLEEQLVQVLAGIGEPDILADAAFALAEARLAQGDGDGSQKYLEEAEQLLDSHRDLRDRQAHRWLALAARIATMRGDLPLGLRQSEAAYRALAAERLRERRILLADISRHLQAEPASAVTTPMASSPRDFRVTMLQATLLTLVLIAVPLLALVYVLGVRRGRRFSNH